MHDAGEYSVNAGEADHEPSRTGAPMYAMDQEKRAGVDPAWVGRHRDHRADTALSRMEGQISLAFLRLSGVDLLPVIRAVRHVGFAGFYPKEAGT